MSSSTGPGGVSTIDSRHDVEVARVRGVQHRDRVEHRPQPCAHGGFVLHAVRERALERRAFVQRHRAVRRAVLFPEAIDAAARPDGRSAQAAALRRRRPSGRGRSGRAASASGSNPPSLASDRQRCGPDIPAPRRGGAASGPTRRRRSTTRSTPRPRATRSRAAGARRQGAIGRQGGLGRPIGIASAQVGRRAHRACLRPRAREAIPRPPILVALRAVVNGGWPFVGNCTPATSGARRFADQPAASDVLSPAVGRRRNMPAPSIVRTMLAVLVHHVPARRTRPTCGSARHRPRFEHLEPDVQRVARIHRSQPAQLFDAGRAEARRFEQVGVAHHAHGHRAGVPAARGQASEQRCFGRGVVDMEGLRVEVAREREHRPRASRESTELAHLAGGKVFPPVADVGIGVGHAFRSDVLRG